MDDQELNGPEEGDYILSPAGRLGAATAVSVSGGDYLETFGLGREHGFDSNEDAALAFVRERMDSEEFWPNTWRQDDHGGLTLLEGEP